MEFKGQVIGIENVINKLTKISGAVKNLSPAFDDMEGVITQEFKANFPAKGSNLQAPWKPRRRAYPWPILEKTGTMKKSWEKKVTPKYLEIKNTTDYATYHHFGGAYLPVRKLVGGTVKIMDIIKTRIEKYIKSLF